MLCLHHPTAERVLFSPPSLAHGARQDLSPIQMMFVMTAFSTIFSFVTLVHQDELMPFVNFVSDHPEIHLHFVAFGVCSTIGQLLIFHTIRSFGAVVFAIIMTVRWPSINMSLDPPASCYDGSLLDISPFGVWDQPCFRLSQKSVSRVNVT